MTPIRAALPPRREVRQSSRIRLVYEAPAKGTPVRGRIATKRRFAVYDIVEGPHCRGAGWGLVDLGAYVCLQHTKVVSGEPETLPRLKKNSNVPFIYARPRERKADADRVPVYRSRAAMNRGEDPIDHLQPHGTYAYERRFSNGKHPAVLVDDKRRAVPLAKMRRFKVSEFSGRDLEQTAPREDGIMAWSVGAPTSAYDHQEVREPASFEIPRHTELLLESSDVVERDGHTWIRVDAPGRPDTEGWARGLDIRRWMPAEAPADVGKDEVWIDVELTQQMLGVYRGKRLVYLTLMSSGRRGDPTPRGLYRIRNKQAYGKMRSLDDADEPYYVEGVPWAQYFHRRYALHAAYWHNRFGRQASHGCVNLAPNDALRIFELTSPTVPGGWVSANEHGGDPGTIVRVRKGVEVDVPDRRNSEPWIEE